MPNKGRLIVIEGLDGSGKETQTNLLRGDLLERGVDLKSVSFPVYTSAASSLVRMYLAGQFGSHPDDVSAYAASAFYAVDRFASYKQSWQAFYEAGGTVLADRYTTSNAIHQCAKLPQDQWDNYLDWLFDFEYHLLGIPQPDLVLCLSMDPAVSERLLHERYAREGGTEDIHESDHAYLSRCRKAAEYCAEKLGWTTVECAPRGQLRTIEDIHDEIRGLVMSDAR